MGARFVDYWENLTEMPKEGPFVACRGPLGATMTRVEQVPNQEGVGCPVVIHRATREFAKGHGLGRGHACASALNGAYRRGELVWRDGAIVPR